jgi:hypothetical protein
MTMYGIVLAAPILKGEALTPPDDLHKLYNYYYEFMGQARDG